MYITNYNLSLLISALEEDDSLEFLDEEILHAIEIASCFSTDEIHKLKKSSLFFKKIASKLPIKFTPIIRKDSKQYLYEERSPAFHLNKTCTRLNTSWFNFYLPSEVRVAGDAVIARFRRITKDHLQKGGSLEDEDFILFLKAEFKIIDPSFGRINKRNSDTVNFSEMIEISSLIEAEDQIKNISKEIHDFALISDQHKKIYDMRYWDSAKINRMTKNVSKEIKELMHKFAFLKSNLLVAIMTYMKYINNFEDSQIEEEILLGLGFRKCSTCFNSQESGASNLFNKVF